MNSFMPQMSPMKWTFILIQSSLNLFMHLILLNSMPLKLKYLFLKKYINKNWQWLW